VSINFKKKQFKEFAIMLLLLFLFNGYFDLIGKNIAVYIHEERIGYLSEYSQLIYAIFMFFGVVGTYNAGFLNKKLGFSRHLEISYGILTLTLTIFWITRTSSIIFVLILLSINFFFMLSIYTNIFSAASSFVNQNKLGTTMGFLLGLGWFGGFSSTLIGGKLADYNADAILIIGILISFISFLIIFLNRQKWN